MKKTTFSHSLLSLCLLFLISILGGGNAVNAQSYQLVTSEDGLVSGDKYLIVAQGNSKALSTTQNDNNRGAVDVTFATDKKDNISTEPSGACVLELRAQDGGTWAFYDASNSGYLYAAGGNTKNNYLRTQTELNDNGKATITVDAKGVATIKFQGANRNWLRYNSSSKLFSCYLSGQNDVYLYHYVESSAVGSTDPELSYTPASEVVLSSDIADWSEPALSSGVIGDLSTLSFTYSSSNEGVATVTPAGHISLTGTAGEAVISAKFDGDATYAAQTPTYTVNVFDPVTLDKEEGTYDNEVTVTLSAAGAQGIVYTTDGTEPTLSNGTKVEATSKELTFDATTTLKAISYYGETLSGVASAVYTIQKVLAVPTITPEGGTFNYEKKVTIASPGAAAIVYTLDGTDPKDLGTGAKLIDGDSKEITITSSCTLKARTTDASMELFSEGLATADFSINLPKPIITLSAESTQEQPITVTIEAEGASHIYYSTDGTDPTATSSSVVEVDAATATFTLSEIGSYTIKAIALNSALDASDAATATCTISKIIPVPGSAMMKYKKVTSMDDIVDGGVYLLVCPEFSEAMSTRENSINYAGVGSVSFEDEAKTIISSISTINEYSYPCELVLEAVPSEEGVYYIKDAGSYIYWSSSTTLRSSESLPVDKTKYKWTISFNTEDWGQGRITILNTAAGNRTLDINKTTTPHRFSTYVIEEKTTTSSPSFLYKKTFDLSVNPNTAGYATAYTAFPYVMPASADGYIVTETAEGATIKAKNKYPAGTEVPAYAPLLIKNAEAGVTLNPVVLGKTVEAYPYAEENLLHGTRRESDGVTTDVDGTNNYYYYKLSYKLDAGNPVPDSYGFYRGKADGSAFQMKNTLTAYLALPRSSGLVNNLRISIDNEEGTTTGIQANRFPADNMPQSIYTLSGVRVNAAGGSLPKGIYIVNGKKVVIK